jgi:hypothetical protein
MDKSAVIKKLTDEKKLAQRNFYEALGNDETIKWLSKMNAFLEAISIVTLLDEPNEPKKVVIPEFVGRWIERCKNENWSLYKSISPATTPESLLKYYEPTINWLIVSDREELFASAWLHGYEVEKDPLYYVKFVDDEGGYLNVAKGEDSIVSTKRESLDFKAKFTEQEIKAMDERFWPFAVPANDETEREEVIL